MNFTKQTADARMIRVENLNCNLFSNDKAKQTKKSISTVIAQIHTAFKNEETKKQLQLTTINKASTVQCSICVSEVKQHQMLLRLGTVG